MRFLGLLRPLALAVLLAGTAGAELPPLIDRELFFGDPEISGAQLSPDGKYMSFIKPYREARNIWVKGLAESFDVARPMTADERPVIAYFWSADSKYLLYAQDKGGNENFHIYAVDPTAAAEAATGVPPARDLTPLENVRAAIYALPEKTPDVILVGLNDRDAAYHDVYRVSIATGERRLVMQNTQKVGSWIFDLDGNLRLAFRQKDDGGNEILRVDGDDLARIYEVTYLESAYPVRFHRDGKRVYLQTNKGDAVDRIELALLDPQTGATERVDSDPEKQVDFGGTVFHNTTEELIATYYVGDRVRVYARNKGMKRDLERIAKQLPDGNIGWGSATEDMRWQLLSVSSDVEPGASYLYDREQGTFTLQYRVRPRLQSDQLAVMKPVTYRARDGLVIHAYLTLPRGVPARNLPAVLHPHGGPWARDHWGYNPYAQFLANRGYAVLQPNFRASSGYGKKFLNAGNHAWGTGAMQHDLSDAVAWLVDQGIADPRRVGIFGGSYGGYATLAGVAFTPELYACGVPYVAPSRLITLIESFPAYWRPFLKGSWYLRVGDPANPEDREDLERRSPLNFVDRIRAPLLVVHGANDPRVKQSESDRIVVALRDKKHDVEYIVAPDEGHGFRAPENNLAMSAAMEKFLAKHLGGRYQEGMSETTAKRLAEIRVDVASLRLPDAAATDLAARAKTAPLPKADGNRLLPAKLEYAVSIEVHGQKIPMTVTRTLEEAQRDGRACWRVTDVTSGAMGASTDVFDLDRATLEPVAREVSGMGTMRITFARDKVSGEMGAGGRTMPLEAALEAPVFGDGAGLDVALAGMDLEPGFEATFRIFEPMTQKVRPMKLHVSGMETVALEGGSYPSLVVAVTPLDDEPGGTATLYLLESAPHQLVKSHSKLPAVMGGGQVTTVLRAGGAADGAAAR
jgi:dipeptidyl aminopeptidase/acylaminoacyl peptidase